MPAAPPDRSEAGEAGAEERDGRRLGHCGRKLGDDDLAVGGLEIRDQDLVCAGVEGAATTAGTSREHAAVAAATVTATTASAESIAPAPTTAEAAAKRASCEIRECAAATAGGSAAATGAEKPAATATTTTGNDLRRVARADHETPAPATGVAAAIAARTADGDLQDFPCGQAEVAADLGTSTSYADETEKGAISALRAKGEDLIGVGRRRREGDETTGIREVEQRGAGGWFRGGERQKRRPTQQKQFHFFLSAVRYLPKTMPVSASVLQYGVVVEERKQRSIVNDG
jgi:hypothetical protein